jgi:MFS transporter, PAT family, beta-lactamase induction signal transducer AmpG
MAACLLLGVSSALPLVLLGDNLQFWLRSEGFDLKTVAFVGTVAAPYGFKFAWAPLLDRYAPPLLDRRRGWLLVAQILLVVTIAAIALVDPRASLGTAAAVATAVAVLGATQDVAIDAWRTDAIETERQAAGASSYVTGYRLGMIGGGSGALLLVGGLGWSWQATYLAAAGAMGLGIAGTLLAPAPRAVSPPATLRDAVVLPFREFFARHGPRTAAFLLVFVVVFKLPDFVAGNMTPAFLIDLGIKAERIGAVRQGLGPVFTIAGTLAGGLLVARLGLRPSLWVFGVLQAVSNLAFLGLAAAGGSDAALLATVAVENFCAGLVTAGFVAFLTSLCDARCSATQYALLTSLMALARDLLTKGPSGWLAEELGWPGFFAASAALGVPGLLLLRWTRPAAAAPPAAAGEAARLAAA